MYAPTKRTLGLSWMSIAIIRTRSCANQAIRWRPAQGFSCASRVSGIPEEDSRRDVPDGWYELRKREARAYRDAFGISDGGDARDRCRLERVLQSHEHTSAEGAELGFHR